jgi:hypothetical protein
MTAGVSQNIDEASAQVAFKGQLTAAPTLNLKKQSLDEKVQRGRTFPNIRGRDPHGHAYLGQLFSYLPSIAGLRRLVRMFNRLLDTKAHSVLVRVWHARAIGNLFPVLLGNRCRTGHGAG